MMVPYNNILLVFYRISLNLTVGYLFMKFEFK